MPEPIRLKSKVCLVGEAAVGKTSLIRRYVLDQFDETYVRTLGAKVSKKAVVVDVPERNTRVEITMATWDVIGHLGFRQLLGDAFFDGAQGILAVADLTRRETLAQLPGWVQSVEGVAGKTPVLLAANKADLTSEAAYGRHEVAAMAAVLGCPHLLTSAKTGQNVEDAFHQLGSAIAKTQLGVR
jgi:small GTP-binding protein